MKKLRSATLGEFFFNVHRVGTKIISLKLVFLLYIPIINAISFQ